MTDLKKNVPALRFPEFEDEWRLYHLKEILEVKSGKDYKHLERGKYPVYGTGGYMLSVSDFLYEGDAIGIGRKGTINKPYLLKGPFWTVDTLFYCIPKKENEVRFLLNLFKTINWKIYDESTGVPSLSKITINKISKSIPEYKEQQRIGNFFSKLDRQIELEEEKLALLEEQKKGYMQKIFSQELRFKDENGEEYPAWEEKKLGEVVAFEKGRLLGKKDLSEEGQFSCILYGELYTTYGAIINRIRSRTNVKSHNLKKAENNQILIPSSGETVEDIATASALDVKEEVYIGGDINILIPKKDDGRFISLSLNSINRWDISKLAQGKTVVHLYNSDLKKLDINLPNSIKEQQKIGNFFSKLDRQIEIQSQKIDLLKQRKQGFLQKMFV
ncbi:TPA: restriction endonuclease subunit S [Staphylococcus delphini]|uniref:restriction endonuclease subunit S n=1 Tax=Staphylococcus delphini TaxID=53344 RepID=UPI000BBC3FF2|nr:restriction endonuclease subunit S [Staphylococcus delphini]PCF47054.1 hypothetical protein B5B98_03570 [Staphylococcus delphini]PCF76288.1 hypothetical protein B4W73_05190 [Staphylococcus delphini]HEC2154706.1 restriction endonuclease subunit S [Staphylococcus delphini]HEC2174846.1 restriction endonuclease subunit S [Staphylococcus delphini]